MVEFALVGSILFILVFGIIDFGRAIQDNTTVAAAVRQGARQASANASSSDSPFSSTVGTCSGTTFTSSVSPSGCLTDAAILKTVKSVTGSMISGSNITLDSNTPASSCPTPAGGQMYLCISPSDGTSASTSVTGPSTCTGPSGVWAQTTYPYGTLGDRETEWDNRTYYGCYLIQVTVKYGFLPLTPVVGSLLKSVTLSSTTATFAEF